MLACEKTMLIILALLVDSFLPLDCRAAIETKEIWPKDDEDSQVRFSLKSARRLLWRTTYSWRDSQSSSSDKVDGSKIAYIFVTIVCLLVILIRCCQKCQSEAEEITQTEVHPPPTTVRATQPPPRTNAVHSRQPRPPQPASRPRFLAAPLSPTTLVLIREDRPHEALFIGIENPNYSASNSSSDNEQSNNNPKPEDDLPPPYSSVIQSSSNYPSPVSVNNSEH